MYRSPLTGTMKKCVPISSLLEEHDITPEEMAKHSEHDAEYWRNHEYFMQDSKKPHSFITASLPEEKYMNNFSDKVKSIINRNRGMKCFGERPIMFSLEFYGKDIEKAHPHLHLLIEGDGMDKAKLIRSLARGFDVKPNFIDYKKGKTAKLLITRQNYIKGIKDESKEESVKADDIFRENNNIEKYYLM